MRRRNFSRPEDRAYMTTWATARWRYFPAPSQMKFCHRVATGRMTFMFLVELQRSPSSISQPPRSINKACFVWRMNGDGFLLCILLKLESYGWLPSMTPVELQQPNVPVWLASNLPNAPSVILTWRDIQGVWSFYQEGFSTVMEQIKVLCNDG